MNRPALFEELEAKQLQQRLLASNPGLGCQLVHHLQVGSGEHGCNRVWREFYWFKHIAIYTPRPHRKPRLPELDCTATPAVYSFNSTILTHSV